MSPEPSARLGFVIKGWDCNFEWSSPLRFFFFFKINNYAFALYLLYRFNDWNRFRGVIVWWVFFSLFITHFCNSDTLRFFPRHTAAAFKSLYDELMISPETVPISWVCEGACLCLSHSTTLVNCKVKSPKPHPVSTCLMCPLLFYLPEDIQKKR